MKLWFILSLFISGYVALPSPVYNEAPYQRYLNFPDAEGILQTIDLEVQPDFQLLNEIENDSANNLYSLFTRANPTSPQTLVMDDAESITASNFNPERPTVVIVHGWVSNQNTGINTVLRDAHLEKADCNVIVLDWEKLASSDYVTASFGVPAVGQGLGRFLAFLNSVTEAPYSSMHLVGFNLGAHIVGNAGKELGGQIARITGLDPSGPLWTGNQNRLNASDAVYVEVIHTDGPSGVNPTYGLGIGIPIGTADFFPNGGYSQPGCLTSICDHNRSWELYRASVTYNHLIGRKCVNMVQMLMNICRGTSFHMGNDNLTKSESGIFRLDTGWRYPY
ncbi:pancreatic lipase-related protein 2 [Papilio machaon]|uniref:pancreatic lipase-related protein 2 n=1 Tax=Papilio machaon TaxID=76193 RepID=UPI001E6644EF|nr:pancreatic lipase-related protein 2 [Papilio machaon]